MVMCAHACVHECMHLCMSVVLHVCMIYVEYSCVQDVCMPPYTCGNQKTVESVSSFSCGLEGRIQVTRFSAGTFFCGTISGSCIN